MRKAAAILLGLAACASAPPVPGPNDSAGVRRGHELYMAKCTLCHDAVPPGDHARSEWPRLVDRFAPRARLAPEQKAEILAYLQEYSR